ncbi:mediator complex subunit Med5-domain-containing protein [Trametes elegans]|nr:mediator complex subunit Med5-domain-containing protein [Trametes elegans]
MSLSELTRNAFQSGITPRKWLALCKLFISKNLSHSGAHSIETDISNSVLVLFRDYPGDPALQAYLKQAIEDGLLSLPIFLTTFLAAAQSPDLHNPATLDMLCRVVLDHHYASGMPTIGSLVPYGEPTTRLLNTIQNAMALLRTAYTFPISHFHQLTTSASELLVLLLSCVADVSQISTAQAMVYFAEANMLLQNTAISSGVREVLESFVFSLSLLLGDDAKAAREAQMMHTLQLALGKSDTILGTSSETDIITCTLLLNHWIYNRASDFGSGDGPHAVAVLVALLRWSSWTPAVFYSQVVISALTCLAQSISPTGPTRASSLWRAFIIGRLPHLLASFQKSAQSEGIAETDWHTAMQFSLPAILHRPDLLDKIDDAGQVGGSDTASEKSIMPHHFTSEFLYQLMDVGLVEQAIVTTINPTLPNDFHPRVASEAQEAGLDLPGFFEVKLSPDASPDDIEVLLYRAWKDPCCHAAFAEVVVKRFASSTSNADTETLSLVCKMLCKHEMALDMLSLHAKMTDLVAHALAFVEDYDCETVGDPQTAVTHLGDVVLFVEATIARFNLVTHSFSVGERKLNPEFLRTAGLTHKVEELKPEELSAFNSWTKALFDPNSEGIEDTILRATGPKVLLKIAPVLFSHAISQCTAERKMDKEVLSNGISYFLGPLLNWTLAGVIRYLLSEIQQRGYNAPIHLEVLKTLLTSPSCPPAVLALSAPNTLRTFPDPLPQYNQKTLGTYDLKPIRHAARQALGLPPEGESSNTQPALTMAAPNVLWGDQAHQLLTNALNAARGGRAVALDVDRCLLLAPPTKFLTTLFSELSLAATMDMEAARRVATFVLTMPRTPRSPPLLPIFLHLVLPSLVASADALSATEQTIQVEFLVAVISSSLTAALHLEWAMLTTCGEERYVLGQSVTSMARRLAGDVRRRGNGTSAGMVMQRLTAMQPFVANFPTFAAEV